MSNFTEITESIKAKIIERDYLICVLSGGFDSFVLTYLVFKLAAEFNPGCKIELWTIPRPNRSEEHSVAISGWLKETFPSINSEFKLLGNKELIEKIHHTQQVGFGIQIGLKQLRKLGLNNCVLFLGDTKNPDVQLDNPHTVYRKRIDTAQISFIMQPFFDIDKSAVVLLAQELNVLEEASIMIHSCSGVLRGRCKKCWQCCERAWAFASLSLTDVGDN